MWISPPSASRPGSAAPAGAAAQRTAGQQRVRGREPGRVVVDDHGDVARHGVEAVLEAQPQVLERVEHAVRAGEVGVVVARGEAERLGLDPGHRRLRLLGCTASTRLGRGRARARARSHAERGQAPRGPRRGSRRARPPWRAARRMRRRHRVEEEGECPERGQLHGAPAAADRALAPLAARAARRPQARLGGHRLRGRLDELAGLRVSAPGAEQGAGRCSSVIRSSTSSGVSSPSQPGP